MEYGLDGIDRFEAFWRRMDVTTPRDKYVHPSDEPFVEAGPPGDPQLQLHMLPIPVNGNLRRADVVILMLNPNFDGPSDALWKRNDPAAYELMTQRQRANIHQRHTEDAHAFYDASPALAAHPGARYWRGRGKLGGLASALASERGVSLDAAYAELSQRIAVLQLFPYRSKTFGHHHLSNTAPSVAQAVALAHYLADGTDKLLVVQRQVRAWGFSFPSDRKNVVVYDPRREARSSSLSPKSRGGPAILARLIAPSRAWHLTVVGRSVAERKAREATLAPTETIGRSLAPESIRQDTSANPIHLSKEPMDRTGELVHLFEQSGLKDVLVTKGKRYDPAKGFSKLMFESNDFRVSSIELYDPKREASYFRIHYLNPAPTWLADTLGRWTGVRNANRTGTNFLGDPMVHAKALADLLHARR